MAHPAFCFLRFVFVSAFVCGVIFERGHENFPLNDCPTKEMDILCLYVPIQSEYEHIVCRFFVTHLLSFPNNKTTPRVLFAGVNDWFSVDNPNVNVSSWRLHESPEPPPYGGQQGQTQDYKNVNEAIDLKGKFVRRLFSEMGGVRKNVSHIAVVFLRARGLSFDGVPQYVQQPDTDVKIFVVVIAGGGIHAECPSDTLILNDNLDNYHKYLLVQAMCNQCLEGWWKFEHRVGAQSMSCYKLENSGNRSAYTGDRSTCYGINSDLVTVESKSELTFLQSMLHSHFIELRKRSQSSQFPARLYLGMSRKKNYTIDRFRWDLSDGSVSRPIVVNKWLPGKPSGGYGNLCAVWQFDWIQEINNASNVSSDEGRLVDGWEDVDCGAKSSFILCETPLPRRVEDSDKIRISPATNASLSRALNKGGFVKFQNNIVSVSFNFDSNDFRQFLQQTGIPTFPVFDCGPDARSPRYISYSLVCNGVNDCNNARDEYGCSRASSNEWESGSKLCHRIICCNGVCLLQRWVNDGEVNCTVCDGSARDDESANVSLNMGSYETCPIYCDDRICFRVSQLNGGPIDCTGLEGPLDRTIGKLVKVDTCHNHYSNIIWVPMCVYVIYIKGAALGCRDMSHLENCSDFECPLGYVKCPSSYCIPQHYVLDGEEDCPTGDDERLEYISPCTGNFACWNSKICLYPDLVCDGHPDCPHKDDELDCTSPCLEGFRCLSGTITVSGYNKSVMLTRLPEFPNNAKYLDMSGLDFSAVTYPGRRGPNFIAVVKFSNCELGHLDVWLLEFFNAPQEVDFSYNRLKIIDGREDVFVNSGLMRRLNLSHNTQLATVKYLFFSRLETLDLSHTNITQIPSTFLKELPSLKHLDLSFTSIRSFEKGLFPSSLNLQTLNLRGLQMEHFYEDFFNGLTVSQDLYTDSFEICCPQIRGSEIPPHTCHAPDVAISSCFDLIGDNVQRVLLCVVAVLAVLGNMAVIVYRVIWDRSVLKTGYGLFVTNLGISDFIMGVYLFIIAGADYYYRGFYVLNDKTWREGVTCRLAGVLATLSSETSMFFILLITLDRFLVMKFPFGQVKLSKINTSIAVCLCWLIGFLLALAPVVFKFEIFTSNAMCVGLPLTTKRLRGWEFSFGVFIAFNFVLCVVIAVGQIAIFKAMSGNRITGAATITSPRRAADIMVAKQLSLVAMSNFLCWFPVGFMGLLSLTGHEISNDVFAWTIIIVLPINSAANPLLYTIPVLMDKWNKFKFGPLRPNSKKIVVPAISKGTNPEVN